VQFAATLENSLDIFLCFLSCIFNFFSVFARIFTAFRPILRGGGDCLPAPCPWFLNSAVSRPINMTRPSLFSAPETLKNYDGRPNVKSSVTRHYIGTHRYFVSK